jgi:hypothetical protein
VTTQLRLVEPPESRPRPAAGAAKSAAKTTSKRASGQQAKGSARAAARRGRTTSARTGRRAAVWGDWHLDDGTRRVGRAGVARARRALEAVAEHELRAS